MKLAAFPKCFMDHIVVERSMSLFDWIAMAADLPIEGVEFHHGFFETLEANYLERVRSALEGRGLAMPMLCCSPDFTKPDPGERRQEVEREKRMIDVTAFLGGGYCRVLSGQRRPEVSREQGVRWVVECIRELLDHAAEKRVVLAMENHYKDNYWGHPEFAQKLGAPAHHVVRNPLAAVLRECGSKTRKYCIQSTAPRLHAALGQQPPELQGFT